MSEQDAQRPIKERIEEKVRGWIDDLAEALDSVLAPAPRPIPIPIRKRY